MRKVKENAAKDFRIKAYAGTNGVLLAFDLSKQRKEKGLLGFAVRQKKGTKPWQFLLNSLTFPGQQHTLPEWGATPSNLAPIQKFRWADYTIEPRTTCKYRVHPVFGTPDAPRLEDPLEVEVETDDGEPSGHSVIFNRAVAASQGFSRRFPDLDALLSANKNMPIEDWPAAPRKWLDHGLLAKIVKFIERAKGPEWTLDLAIYEYELAAIVAAIDAAHARGVDVRVIYHAKVGDHQTAANVASLARIPKAKKRGRVTTRIFHNKFIVLGKVDAAGARKPRAVLCGSTNFTENGVYRQANVVHTIDDKAIASRYAELFEVIWLDPAKVATAKKWIDANNALDPAQMLFAGFSPRSKKLDLDEFARTIGAASHDVLFATAFALPDSILDALLGRANDSVLRYGIQNTASRITGFHADRTAEFTATALLTKGLEGWVKEGLKGQRGNLLVHTKAVIVDFTSDAPTVISGSHNLSASASGGNDENFLILRGDTDLADRYGLEILRFYEHYRFRYYAKLLKLQAVRPLEADERWANAYYAPRNLKRAARLRFVGKPAEA